VAELLLSLRRADDLDGPPILMTTDQAVVEAALDALDRVLRGRERQALKLARYAERQPTEREKAPA